MDVFTRVLLLSSFAHCSEAYKFMNLAENQIDFGRNRETISNIFKKVSTISVLSKSLEGHDYVYSLQDIFTFRQAFAVFDFTNDRYFEHCKVFQSDLLNKISYYDRQYQKSHGPLESKYNLQYSEGSEPVKTQIKEEIVESDSQHSIDKLPESFYDNIGRWFKFEQSGYFIFCSFDVFELQLGCLVKRAGTYLFVIEKSSLLNYNLEDVSEVLKRAWKKTENLKIFVSCLDELYVMNPFKMNKTTKNFGVLEKLTEEGMSRNLKNLNDYPLRIEIFDSAYSIRRWGNSSEFPDELDLFYGPDVDAARFIEERMNASSN